MSAPTYNFTIHCGETFAKLITYQDSSKALVNLSNYTAAMHIRDLAHNLIIDLNTTNGRITLGGTAGTIRLALTSEETGALTPGSYVYDLFLFGPANTIKLLEGVVQIESKVTEW